MKGEERKVRAVELDLTWSFLEAKAKGKKVMQGLQINTAQLKLPVGQLGSAKLVGSITWWP